MAYYSADDFKRKKDSLKEDGREDGELEDDDGDSEEDTNAEVYCICRKSDTTRFMIGCDNCEEWYHGDCISITAEFAKKILKFFCLSCRAKDSSLEIQYKEKKQPKKKVSSTTSLVENLKPDVIRGKDAEEVRREDPDYRPDRLGEKSKYFESDDDDEFSPTKSRPNKQQNRSRPAAKDKKQSSKSAGAAKRGVKRGKGAEVSVPRSSKKTKQVDNKTRRGHRTRGSKDTSDVVEGPRQCRGPACTEIVRKGSKYCSDECGLRLATNRLYEILPNRIRQWQSTPSVADDLSRQAMDKIRQEQLESRKILEDLDKKQEALDKLVEAGRLAPPLSKDEEEDYDEKVEVENELSIYCVSCGHEVSYRFAMRHMEKCFNKYEAQTSYGSIFKTKIDNLFCDFYNAIQSTYCKRLRILCPEHSKDPKVGEEEVCGAPVYSDVFEHTGDFCRVYKKKCQKHFCWEKLRRAEIDMERVQQWLAIDDLFEREQKIRFTMSNRGGVLGLMLHQTIASDIQTAVN